MIVVESMTAGAIRRGGLDDGRIWMLLRDLEKKRARSVRALEIAAGSRFRVHVLSGSPRPGETAHGAAAMLICRVRLTRHAWWEEDTLYGHFPDTIRIACIGRRLGEIVDHPDLDPDAIAGEPTGRGGNAVLSVPRTTARIATPDLRTRLTHPFFRLRLLYEEGRVTSPMPSRIKRAMEAMAVLTTIYAIVRMREPTAFDGIGSGSVTAGAILAAVYSIANAVRAHQTRPFVSISLLGAATNHHRRMDELEKGDEK